MNVAITGGTGFVGSHLSNRLAEESGISVTAISRNPDETAVPIDESVEREYGDVTDASTLDFEGVDVVVHLVALSPLFKPKGTTHKKVHLNGTRNVVEAAEDAGVERIVQMSALGADSDGDTEYIRTKGEAEKVVRESELDYTMFRPSVVFGEGDEFIGFTKLLTTPVVTGLPGGGKSRFQPIWVGDLADIMAQSVVDEDVEHTGKVYEIGGPQVLTLAKISKMVYRAEGKSLKVLPVPMFMAKIGLTLADPLPFVPMGADQYRSLKIDNVVNSNDVGVFGYDEDDLKTLGEYLGLEE
ncbi:MAG: complex I NDUFA9 subunit family protein [Halobacteria archaeon]|nr:complex I NDUFA9 subunit family protein [Halobacteria archaeon]